MHVVVTSRSSIACIRSIKFMIKRSISTKVKWKNVDLFLESSPESDQIASNVTKFDISIAMSKMSMK